MAEAYSGLRIRRKRVHSAKCSCCCSDDEHASGRKEEGDDSSKNQTAARSRQRSKVSLSEVEDENNNNNNSRSLQNAKAENSKGGEHCLSHDSNGSRDVNSRPAKKRQVRTLRSKTTKKAKTSQQGSKDSEKRGTEILLESSENKGKTSADRRSSRIAKGVVQSEASQLKSLGSKKKNAETDGAMVEKPDSSKDNSTGKQKNGRGKSAKKRKGVKQKETFQGSDSEEETQPNINTEIVQSKLLQKKKRVSDRKLGNGSSQISSKKHKKSRNGQESDSQNAQQSTNSKGKINIIGSKSEDLTVLSKEVGESSRDSEKLYAKGSEQDERKKTQCKDSISTLDDISKTKIRVFDHLFQELKKCQGQSKTTMASAAAFLLGINMEQLSPLVRHRDVKSRKTEPNNAKEVAREKDKISIEKGFRENEEERRVTEVCESDVIFPAVGVQSSASQFGVAPAQQVSRASNAEEMNLSQAAEALVSFMSNPTVLRQDTSDPSSNFSDGKSKGERHLSQSVEQTTKASESNWAVGQLPETVQFMMQAGALQALAPVENQQEGTHIPQIHGLGMQQPQVLPQMPLSSLMTVLPQLAMTQNNLATLSQFMAQSNPLLNVSTAPSTTPTSTPTAKAPVVSIPPVLFGSHPPLLSFTQMSASSAAKTFVTQSNTVMRSQQQPLKGMEEVVGNVGANASSMLWNLKPAPVVYLASPQTLGGVPRNLVPSVNQNAQGIPLGSECDPLQSGVTSVQQNFDISPDKALRINPGVTRPILPKEHSVGSSQALPSGAVSKVVSQPVGDTSGGAQQGSLGMSHHRAMNSVSSTTLPTSPVSGTTSKSSSTSASLTAKQAVKRFVHERTRSAELRREGSLSNMGPLDEMQQSFKRGKLENIPSLPATGGNSNVQQGSPPKSSDFNLQQAATTLLSIAVPEGAEPADREESPDEPEEEVVFTSKGVFRVGDVDVDPQYNRMGREGYTCGKCGKIFTSLSYLARHIKRVCPDMSCRKWKCNMCDKAFRHPFGLQQHIYTHTGERPHKCPECPKAFYSSNDLRRHSRIHSGERPYQCKHCQKTFATTISLKTHTYIHTGEKPHKCPHCPKTFATSSKLGRHIVTHSEQRPFSCDQCPKAFNRSGDLRRHSLHVHETREKPSECDECNAPVSTTAYLNMHQNTLKAETPATKAVQSLKCSVCGQEFSDLSDLDKHQKTHKTAAGKFA